MIRARGALWWCVAASASSLGGAVEAFRRTNDLKLAAQQWCRTPEEASIMLQYGSIAEWDVSGINDLTNLFNHADCIGFDADLNAWDTSSVTKMLKTFRNAAAFTSSLDGWNVSKVTDVRNMFYGAASFAGDLNSWQTGSFQNMMSMFQYATAFNTSVADWDVSRVTSMSGVFRGAHKFNSNLSSWQVSHRTSGTLRRHSDALRHTQTQSDAIRSHCASDTQILGSGTHTPPQTHTARDSAVQLPAVSFISPP